MATKSKGTPNKANTYRNSQPKLEFHSPSLTRAEKTEAVGRLVGAGSVLPYFREMVSENDWLKLRYDTDNGVWIVMHTFTAESTGEQVGIVTYRAKQLENALAFALWNAENISDSDFLREGDDEF